MLIITQIPQRPHLSLPPTQHTSPIIVQIRISHPLIRQLLQPIPLAPLSTLKLHEAAKMLVRICDPDNAAVGRVVGAADLAEKVMNLA